MGDVIGGNEDVVATTPILSLFGNSRALWHRVLMNIATLIELRQVSKISVLFLCELVYEMSDIACARPLIFRETCRFLTTYCPGLSRYFGKGGFPLLNDNHRIIQKVSLSSLSLLCSPLCLTFLGMNHTAHYIL